MRQVYLAGTGRNHGKTTFALGLMAELIDRGYSTAFTKPVGQRYALVDEVPADEDAILMRELFGLHDPLADMSPVHIPRGFTRSFIRGEVVEDLSSKIDAAHQRLSRDHDLLLIEGTGHAGVGAVVGLSNADVAARLRAPVIVISEGGIGRPIDHIVLNQALFASHGVPLVGAVINKIDADADATLSDTLARGLARHGVDLLGVLPYRPMLSHPTLTMLIEQLHGELLSAGEDMDRLIEHVAIGSGQARHVLEKIGPGSLLIVQGDRQDIIHTTISANETQRRLNREPGMLDRLRNRPRFGRIPDDPEYQLLAGIVFTNGRRPSERDIAALREAGIFALLVQDEIYPIASQIHGLLVKTHVQDRTKIEVIKEVVAEHFDVDGLLDRLDRPTASRSSLPHGLSHAAGDAAAPARGLAERGLQRLTEQASRLTGARGRGADRG
jgi:BioD-like phosphotransacetylase family protein